MTPKAILKFPKRSTKKWSATPGVSKEKDSKYPTTVERLTYCFLEKKELAEDKIERDVPDRVLWIEGELGGLGFPMRDAKLMAQALDFGHDTYRGRQTRGLILSCEEVLPENEHLRAGIFQSIRDSLIALAERLGVTRWLAIAHDDRHHPHVHFIFRNWDEEKRRRLDIRPKQLSDLQSMDWTDQLQTGRGSVAGRNKVAKTEREKELEEYRAGLTPKQKEVAARKLAPIKALQEFLNTQKVPTTYSPQGLAQFLYDCPSLPSDWDRSKLLTKKGEQRNNPAIIIAGEGLKLNRFFQFITLERKRRKKSPGQEKKESEKGI